MSNPSGQPPEIDDGNRGPRASLPGESPMSEITSLLERLDDTALQNNGFTSASALAYEDHLVQARLGMASSLFTALRCKHAATAAHSLRVALGCSAWALAMDLPDDQRQEIEVAALLHDVGKIGVPDGVLLRPGKLNPDQTAVMDRHHRFGIEILRNCCASPAILDNVKYAPAWFDGSKQGLPQSGSKLPLGSRMIAIVDAFDSMVTDQVYRPAMSRQRALHELLVCSGSQFDPSLTRDFHDLQESDQQKLDKRVADAWLLAMDDQRSNNYWHFSPSHDPAAEFGPEARFQQALLENMHDGVVFLDSNLQVILWNRGAERLTGIPSASIHQRPFLPSMVDMRDEKGVTIADRDCPVAFALNSKVQSLRRLIISGRAGRDMAVDAHTIPVTTSDGITHGATLLLHDASPEASLEERCQSLHEKAIKDPLTQLANRAEFDRVLKLFVEVHLQRGLPCSLIICDIDRFKHVNDSYGHQAGDEVIKSFAGILKAGCRPGDLAARYGGEEFVMLCADCNNSTAAARAEQIRQQFGDVPQPMLDGRRVTASFGVTEVQPGDSADTMLARADRALLTAKQGGRNAVVQLGTGIGDGQEPVKRRWWSWNQSTPNMLLDRNLVTSVPLKVTVEKLRGFIADHQAQIMSVEGNKIHFATEDEANSGNRRSTDRPASFLVELDFIEERVQAPNSPTSASYVRTKIHVIIRPKRSRDRRRTDCVERARNLLTSLRSYLMAADHNDSDDEGVLRRATSMILPWLTAK